MAASVQKIFEEALLNLISRASHLTGESRLCYAGGAALNCVANSKLLKSGVFERVYIPNEPGDGGAAIGAAYLSLKKVSRQVRYENCAIGTGKGKDSYKEEDIILLSTLDPAKTMPYIRLSNTYRPYKVIHQTVNDELELVSKVAKLIAQRKAIGWFKGVYEFGPRALGQRSILFRPDDVELMERVSKKIKSRASFRPYALSMTEENASQLLDLASLSNACESLQRMQLAVPVKVSFTEQVRCGLHIDGSTRPQVVTQNNNIRFYNLLSLLSEKYNIPALINTSFNENSFPIVADVEHAFLMFYRTELDVLVIDNHIIKKEES
ncbi:MAG: hypothetical protein KBD78_17275 [Oligoflexales bacterium]|nr:hypothetical protein [Oligoflexales bacterium]